ncbi:MAG: hypothetical protein RL469_438, partial [Pseudomonadota bacterium]
MVVVVMIMTVIVMRVVMVCMVMMIMRMMRITDAQRMTSSGQSIRACPLERILRLQKIGINGECSFQIER